MSSATDGDPIVREIHIDATPETVFEFFTDPTKLTRWLAAEATLDPRPGGVCHQVHAGGERRESGPFFMRGEFVEVFPPERVVFTWGFTNPEIGVSPGSSVVEVTLTPARRAARWCDSCTAACPPPRSSHTPAVGPRCSSAWPEQ